MPKSTRASENKRTYLIAFVVGAVVHIGLLGLSISGVFAPAALLLLVFALPGAFVDISAEMIRPSEIGGDLLALVGSIVNGGAYALAAWIVVRIRSRK